MSDGWRVTQDDSTDLGFALWCLTCAAIEHDEFVAWVYRVVAETDEPLPHLLGLGETTDRLDAILHGPDIIGWEPDWAPSGRESAALDGLAYLRDPLHESDATDRGSSLQALRDSPDLLTRFARSFPDIALPALPATGRDGG